MTEIRETRAAIPIVVKHRSPNIDVIIRTLHVFEEYSLFTSLAHRSARLNHSVRYAALGWERKASSTVLVTTFFVRGPLHMYKERNVARREFSNVSDFDMPHTISRSFQVIDSSRLNRKVRAAFQFAHSKGNFIAFVGGFSRCGGSSCALFTFIDSAPSVIGGEFRVMESKTHQNDTNERDKYRRDGCPKHAFCPESHVLLSFQIGYFALLLPLTCLLVFFGYKIAYRALYALQEGRIIYGLALFMGAILLACGSALLLPGLGYWFAFEGGAWAIL